MISPLEWEISLENASSSDSWHFLSRSAGIFLRGVSNTKIFEGPHLNEYSMLFGAHVLRTEFSQCVSFITFALCHPLYVKGFFF